jgi:hypothetical protein
MRLDYTERFPKEEDKSFTERGVRYQQECVREVDEIISKNLVRFEDFDIGEKIRLYFPLKELSKIKFDENDEPHRIREIFKMSNKCYGLEMCNLFWNDSFTIYDKNERDNTLRISEKPKNVLDLFPAWVDFRYFEN